MTPAHAEPPAAGQRIRYEVERPALVGALRNGHRRPRAQRPFPAATRAHRQPLFAIQPVHLLQVQVHAFTPEQDREPAIAEPATLVGELVHPLADSIILSAKRLMLPRRPVDPDQPAGATLGQAVVGHQLLHRSVAIHRPGQFFPADPSAPTRPASIPPAASSAAGSRPPAFVTSPLPTRSSRRTSSRRTWTSSCRTSHRCDVLPAQLGGLRASLVLTPHPYDLILGKTASPHRSSPYDELTYLWHDFRAARHFLASSTRIQVRHGAHLQPLRLSRGKTVDRLTMP